MIKVNVTEMNSVKNEALEKIQNYITNAIAINKDQIAFSIKKKGKDEIASNIILIYVDYILSHGFSNYSQKQLLELISSGVVFTARQMFFDHLMSEELIMEAIRGKCDDRISI